MRVFSAALATETEYLRPDAVPACRAFTSGRYFPAGEHPNAMQTHGGPLWAARGGRPGAWPDTIEGLVAAAVPNGTVTRAAYEGLGTNCSRICERRAVAAWSCSASHGAMIADGYDDCEGDLLVRVREIVGLSTIVGHA